MLRVAALLALLGFVPPAADSLAAQSEGGHADHDERSDPSAASATGWRMPPMPTTMPMLPPLEGLEPVVSPFLPGAELDPDSLPEATFRRVERLEDGDTLTLRAGFVRRRVGNRTFVMYGFNGQAPGPLIRVPRDAEIVVAFENAIDLPSSVHWHGVRVENRFDGVPGVTQDAVAPGAGFTYRVRFPDAGIYWYHPHHREDIQQELGLYGNLLVDDPDPAYYGPANREEVLLLDDLLVDDAGLFPFGEEAGTHALMGRFGNVLLVNGEPDWELETRRGEVVRFHLTNVANTRTFNLVFEGAETKLVAADVSRFERETRVESVPIAPAQRYVVDARFPEAGTWALTNRIQAIDHFNGTFYARVDTLGLVTVSEAPVPPEEDHGAAFANLREHVEVTSELDGYRSEFGRPVDFELELSMRVGELPTAILAIMALDTLYQPPVEWNDAMPLMNYLSSSKQVSWVLREPATGRENRAIEWSLEQGEVYRVRIHNLRRAFHPMQHPIHVHGQRFLVLARDGVPNHNLAWKDTAVIPTGATFDLLLEASNPGEWMLHCHIAEHLDAGMAMTFTVAPAETAAENPGAALRIETPRTDEEEPVAERSR